MSKNVSVARLVPWSQVCKMLDIVQSAVKGNKKEMLLKFITQYRDLLRKSTERNPQAIHRPNSVDMPGLPRRERVRLKKRARELRVGTLNFGTMTGRGRAIADLMKTRQVDILCVQETRWKGNKARELGEGYKMFYSGANKEGRNGVGIILSSEMKKEIVEVNRRNDRIIWVRLMVENCTVNIFSAYAPQIGCSDEEKDHFWSDLEEEMEKVPADERCLVGRGSEWARRPNKPCDQPQFKEKVLEELTHEIGDVDEWWNRTMEIILRVAREILGESSGKMFENKETWWFSEEVKDATKQKREAKKRWEGTQMEEDWMAYKEANKLAKKTVAIAKDRAYDQLYKELDTQEGQGKILKLAHMRNKNTKDITHIRQIKDGNILRNERHNKERGRLF
ncbi:uncharacterized protein LOC135207762 [Macrobrachium nipponense]|uniref:uncharacterized protein LOC135207762 n=1 Tax=Macrobrachium nipponense TaxID=159736 RepID=UPI0030C8AF88